MNKSWIETAEVSDIGRSVLVEILEKAALDTFEEFAVARDSDAEDWSTDGPVVQNAIRLGIIQGFISDLRDDKRGKVLGFSVRKEGRGC